MNTDDQKQQTKRQKIILRDRSTGQTEIETSRQLRQKNRDSETQTTDEKTRLRDP